MASDPTTGELFKGKVIVEADVVGAVEAILAGLAQAAVNAALADRVLSEEMEL